VIQARIQARKSEKLGATREQLAKLLKEPIPRVRIRNSSGTFEVTLISMDEERSSVVVLWDGNVHREFKWGSIVWGPDGKGGDRKQKSDVGTSSGTSVVPHPAPQPTAQKKKTSVQKQSAAPNVYPSGSGNPSFLGSYPVQPSSYSSYGYPYPYYYPTYVPPGGKPSTVAASVPYQPYTRPPTLNISTAFKPTTTTASRPGGSNTKSETAPSTTGVPQANISDSTDGLKALSEAAVSAQTQ
jgi:hypothetical protein